jgi:hypothetical protein
MTIMQPTMIAPGVRRCCSVDDWVEKYGEDGRSVQSYNNFAVVCTTYSRVVHLSAAGTRTVSAS